MATIIWTSDTSGIIGDPPDDLDLGQHWCASCGGSGLEYDYDGELLICLGCYGRCVVDCTDTACLDHSTLHPFQSAPNTPRDSDAQSTTRQEFS